MRRLVVLFIVGLALLLVSCSSTIKGTNNVVSQADQTDYVRLRAEFAQSEAYNPYDIVPKLLWERAKGALHGGNQALAVARAESLLTMTPLSLETQYQVGYIFSAVGDSIRSAQHVDEFLGLYAAATVAGFGSSPDSAITVIYVGEEYTILYIMGSELITQSLVEIGNHTYDLMTVRKPASGDTAEVFFNVDYLVGYWPKLLGH